MIARHIPTDRHIGLKDYIRETGLESVKLHLACGGERWKDFINVDLYPEEDEEIDSSRWGCDLDVIADITDLGLDSASVDEIFTSHSVEHFTKWIGIQMFRDWYRILKPGGKLHIETPDFWRCVFWLFHVSRRRRLLARNMFYGNQWDQLDYETHRYLWSGKELKRVLVEVGFSQVHLDHRTLTHCPGRDMRIIAVKSNEAR